MCQTTCTSCLIFANHTRGNVKLVINEKRGKYVKLSQNQRNEAIFFNGFGRGDDHAGKGTFAGFGRGNTISHNTQESSEVVLGQSQTTKNGLVKISRVTSKLHSCVILVLKRGPVFKQIPTTVGIRK